jgi:DUF2934 family protein
MPKKAIKAPGTGKNRNRVATESVDEAIQRRAYELHLEHGGPHGRDLDDWLEAEREIQAQYHSPATRTRRKK